MAAIDLTGQRFGSWVVIERHKAKYTHALWRCRCDCGNEAIVRGSSLRQGKSKCCGCDKSSVIKANTKHSGYGTRLYRIWTNMKMRCTNPHSISYPNYGAKGITVCSEWMDFKPFHDWAVSHGYADNLTIDRINCNKEYSPDNCRWVDMITQQNNKSSNRLIAYKGRKMTLKQWARALQLSYNMLYKRIQRGWSFETAINTSPTRKIRKVG